MGKKRNNQSPSVPIPGRVKVEIKDELGNKNLFIFRNFISNK